MYFYNIKCKEHWIFNTMYDIFTTCKINSKQKIIKYQIMQKFEF